MKPISLTVHGAIDYLAVVIFAVAPAAIGGLKTLYYPFDFLWGDQIALVRRRERRRNIIFSAVGLGLLVGVISSYIAGLLPRF